MFRAQIILMLTCVYVAGIKLYTKYGSVNFKVIHAVA
jgi:hypothetical protein